MKAKLFVIGLFLFALTACVQKAKAPEPVEGPTYELQSIDSLMWRHPDSALMRLLPWFDTCCRDAARHVSTASAYNRHYANLLLSELLYKNDYPQTNRRELQQAVAYFDSISQVPEPVEGPSNRIAFLDARVHYINGVGYYENDSVVEACKEYMKALEVMENHFEEKELVNEKAQFVAYSYTRLTDLFSDLYLHEQTIYFAQRALTYYRIQNTVSWYGIHMLNEIGSQYDMLKQSDSATFYYQKAISAMDDTTTLMYRDIAAHLICLEYKKGISQTDTATKRLRKLLQKSKNDRESHARYMNIGETFYHEQNYDSAWVYLDTVFQMTSVVGLKRQAAEWLIEICKIQGRDNDILEYADFLVPYANQEENQSAIKSELTELYKAFGQSQQERQHKKEIRRHRNHSMAVIAGLSLVILIILALYHNNKHRKQYLENQINEEKLVHSIEKKALASRLKNSNETLRELQNQIKQQNKIISIKSETQATTFMDEPICRLIMERVHAGQFKAQINCNIYKDYALSKEQLVALQDAANQHFDLFTVRLVQAFPDITKSDLDYCCLHLLGLNDADMSALMQRAYNTINERNSKLKKVLGCKSSISIALKAFANNSVSN